MTFNAWRWLLAVAMFGALVWDPQPLRADEDGVSFWLPGQFGSLAAIRSDPGWSVITTYYHTSAKTDIDISISRQIRIGRFRRSVNFNVDTAAKARGDIAIVTPTYTFATPIFGGQLAAGLALSYGRVDAATNTTAAGRFGRISILQTGSLSDSATGFDDLVPQTSLRWNMGSHNFMTYLTGDIPVGSYDASRLANIGLGHAAIDGGAGYTYLDTQNGHEFSAVGGLTYNFTNTHTQYRNGIDFHLDWGASQFFSEHFHVGAVGYMYQQLSADSGQIPELGSFKSRVMGAGPQVGFIFPVGDMNGYLNFKVYGEFNAANRAAGWNSWLTFVISPKPDDGLPPNVRPRPPI